MMEFHEIANIFPLISGKEFETLCADIQSNGLHQPIVTYGGTILDGRNRYLACQKVMINPEFVEYQGNDPIGFVLSLNLHRRHLKSDQRAAAAVDALPLYEKEAKERQGERTDIVEKIPQSDSGKSRDKAAEDFHTNPRYVSDMKKIKEDDPETFEQIKAGEKRLVDVKKDRKKEERKKEIEKQKDDIASSDIPVIEKKYHVISIDPPWPYENGADNSYDSEGRRVSNPYPEMSIEQIAALEMPAADDSVLWLWTTHKFLPDAFGLLDVWGFDYKATMVWDKQSMGMGHWLRMQCEFCLLAIRGHPVWTNTIERDLLRAKRREHSRKPDEFFTVVNEICPGAKLEYFSRENRDGWDGFGNDTEKFDE